MAPKRRAAKSEEKTSANKRRKSEGSEAPARKSARRAATKAQPEKKSAEAKQSGQHRTAGKSPGAKVWSKRDTRKRQLPQEKNVVQPVLTDKKELPPGVKRDSRDRLVFPDFPEFRPTLTPKQVIQAGSFGGIYFNPIGGRKGIKYPKGVKISADEFPKDWFAGLRDEQFKGRRYNVKLNRYGVKSGQNQQQWEEQGWIRDQDPRGWFQWYCRFALGRRTEDDERQISRWRGVAGPKGRWKTSLVNKIKNAGAAWNDGSISPVVRQNLLHWAYELTEKDYDALAKGQR